jgi:hypothetical protein
MKNNKPNLKSAYALETVEDNLELYANWASDYENDFASSMDYILPNQVAQIFSKWAAKDLFLTSELALVWEVWLLQI